MKSLAGKLTSGITRLAGLGRQSGDPLTNLKAATRWLDNLPVGDALKCQQAILEELKRFNENPSEPTKVRLGVLMLLDEKSRDLQDTLVHQYLRNPRMSRPVESQLWHAVYSLHWEIARGYHTFVLHFARGSGKSSHDGQIPLITLRALRAFGQLLKWRAVRYLGPGEKLWLRLHNLYRVAESEGFQRQSQIAYAGEKPCSCESAYLHVMMLNLANSGTLYPRQIDLLDRWLCQWHSYLTLGTHVDARRHAFTVDLSADHGPRRVRKTGNDKPTRYWVTGELLDKLEDIQRALREGRAPAALGLGEAARPGESIDLLEHLRQHWSPLAAREQRRAPRETAKRLVDVVHSFKGIVNEIRVSIARPPTSPYSIGINDSEADDVSVYGFVTERTRERISRLQIPAARVSPDVERWVMQDESVCGYGAVVESRDRDWLRIGALLALKSQDNPDWRLGVIRRLSRVGDDSSSIGIDRLPETPLLVMLHEVPSYSAYIVDDHGHCDAPQPKACLWLETPEHNSLILDPVNFAPGKVFQANLDGERRVIALGHPIERSEGWIRVGIEPVRS